jgi:hypothetical protein
MCFGICEITASVNRSDAIDAPFLDRRADEASITPASTRFSYRSACA